MRADCEVCAINLTLTCLISFSSETKTATLQLEAKATAANLELKRGGRARHCLRSCRSYYYRLLTIEFGSILDWMSGGQQEGRSYPDYEGREGRMRKNGRKDGQ